MNIRRFQRIERFDRHGSLLFYLQFQREDEGQSTGGGGRDASTHSQRWLDQYPGDGPSEAAAAESTVEIKKLRAHLGQPDCVIEGDMTACSQVPDIMVAKKAKDICFANEVEIKAWLKRKADDADDPDDPDDPDDDYDDCGAPLASGGSGNGPFYFPVAPDPATASSLDLWNYSVRNYVPGFDVDGNALPPLRTQQYLTQG